MPAQIPVGSKAELEIIIESAAGQVIPDITVALEVNDILDDEAEQPIIVAAREGFQTIPLYASRRGIAEIKTLWAKWRGPIGLTERLITEMPELKIPVVPNLKRVFAGLENLVGAAGADFGERPHPRQGSGSDFSSLRDYIPGMDLRTVDWKRSARYRGLLAKEFEAERNHQIILAYDTGHLMRENLGGISRLDHSVEAGLALTHAALRSGDRVGMYAFDADVHTYVKPVGGMRAFPILQQYLAGLECSTAETNFTLGLTQLSQQLNRRTLVVLFTDFVDTTTAELMRENISYMARRHLVIFVAASDPFLDQSAQKRIANSDDISRAMIAGEILKERRVLFERLRAQGILCLEPKESHMIGDLLREYRTIIKRELI